jgi:hypothetical protein
MAERELHGVSPSYEALCQAVGASAAVCGLQRWFKELTDRRLRGGTFTSVPVLIEAIQTWVSHRNQDPKPFIWHAAADEILEKVRRGREALSQVKSATQH